MSEISKLVTQNHPLKDLNWWKVGGAAEFFSAPVSVEELELVYKWAVTSEKKIWVISGGSNVLVRDGVVSGLVLSLHHLKGIVSQDTIKRSEDSSDSIKTSGDKVNSSGVLQIKCLSGTPKSDVAKIFLQNKLAPAVFLTGIPGDMGGGVVMNAGIGESRIPREFCEIVKEIEVLRFDSSTDQTQIITYAGSSLKWEYRHSSGWQPGVITKVTVAWPMEPDPIVLQEVKAQTKKRVSTQPLDLPSCGSVFRNPVGHKSAQLIEGCGLKGFRIGGACVSTKHANFIVNDQGAKASDIRAVIEHVQNTVRTHKGIELKTEVVFIGDE